LSLLFFFFRKENIITFGFVVVSFGTELAITWDVC
jgi:hypothetical protein